MDKSAWYLLLGVISLLVFVLMAFGLVFGTVHNVVLAWVLIVLSYLAIPFAIARPQMSDQEVLSFKFYLQNLIVWTGCVLVIVAIMGFVALLSLV